MLNRKLDPLLTSLVLMAMVSFSPINGLDPCITGDEAYYDPSLEEIFDAADVIFLGRNQTGKEVCTGDCWRETIDFQILCVIKPVGFLLAIPSLPVKLGPSDECSNTPYLDNSGNELFLVTVTPQVRTDQDLGYNWQELKAGTSAAYPNTEKTWKAVEKICQSATTCPAGNFTAASSAVQNCDAAAVECPALWIKSGSKCVKISKGVSLIQGLAREHCEKQDGRLVRLDEVTWASIQRHLPTSASNKWWTAGARVQNTTDYVWRGYGLNDQEVNFTAWTNSQVQNMKYIVVDNQEGWSTTDDDMQELEVICEKDAIPARPWHPWQFRPQVDGFAVTFSSPWWSMYLCCEQYSYPAKTFVLTNENQGSPVSTADLSKIPKLQLPNTFEDVYYSVLMTSYDTRLPVATSYVTWLKINMAASNASGGSTILEYERPTILDDKEHYFVISLYQQQKLIENSHLLNEKDIKAYSQCDEPNNVRCNFYVHIMTSFEGLVLVDQMYVTASRDAFSVGSLVEGKPWEQAKVCRKYYPGTQTHGMNVACPIEVPDSGQDLVRSRTIVTSLVIALAWFFV